MKHEVKGLPNSAAEVKIFLTKEEIEPTKNEILADMASKVEIPGFRKGKAPVSKVEQEYKDSLTGQLVEKMLDKYYDEVIKSENITPISYISDLGTDLKEDGLDIKFVVDVYPDVQLGNYKGLEAEKEKFTMSQDILDKELDAMVNSKAKLENTEAGYKAQMGDSLDIAFEGSIDGKPFEGGKSDSHMLKLGSKMFIDNFEEQLVGYEAGQEGEVKVTFPANYHQADLANKPAVFKVKVHSIKKLKVPALDDALAKEFGYESLEDLKTKKYKEVEERETNRVENEYRGKLLDKIAADTKVELPFSMIAGEIRNRINDMEHQLSMQGIGMDMYLKMTGMDMAKLEQQVAPMAAMKVKTDLILEAIAKQENIDASEDEVKDRMTEIASYYSMDLAKLEEELRKNGNTDNFKNTVKMETIMKKAVDFIVNEAKK